MSDLPSYDIDTKKDKDELVLTDENSTEVSNLINMMM